MKNVTKVLGNLDALIAGTGLVLIVLMTVAGVFMRKVVGRPFAWLEEMQIFFFVWTIYFGGSVAFTPYHASSAGWTNPSSEVWGGSYSYLKRVESIHDPSSANKDVTAVFSMSRVKSGLENLLGITLDEADPARWLEVTAVSDSGYVLSVKVTDASGGSHTVTGRQVREAVLAYGIRSHAFTVSWNGEAFVFVTNGYGHGVGMSQTGAEGYAQDGWSYQQILNHYYPGTTVR